MKKSVRYLGFSISCFNFQPFLRKQFIYLKPKIHIKPLKSMLIQKKLLQLWV